MLRRTSIVVEGVSFYRFKAYDQRYGTHRVIWAVDQQHALGMAMHYANAPETDIDLYPSNLVLNLEPIAEFQEEK